MLSTDPSYDNRTIASTLKMHCWLATNNRVVPRVMKTKFPATVMVFGVVSSEGHIMPPHIFEVGLKVNTKVYLDVLKSVVIPWCNQVAGGRSWVWQQDSAPAHKSKETQAWLQKECYDFVSFSHWPPPPPTWARWTTSFGHTPRTSPTWPPIYIYIYIYEMHTISFQTFFVWILLLIVHTWNSTPFQSNLLWLQCTHSTIPTTSGRPSWKSSCVSVSMTFMTASFISSIVF